MKSIFDRATESAQFIRSKIDGEIHSAVVLGSGLGVFAETLSDKTVIPYEDIPGFARSTVEGHKGRLVAGKLADSDKQIIVMQGRFHYYEGYQPEDVTLPIRAFGVLGIKSLVITNAAGAINKNFKVGDFMLLKDHINLMMVSPLRGPHDNRLGERFPDMTEVYSRVYRQSAQEVAAELGIQLQAGVYMALQGPNYETPAEIKMFRLMGADAVGMSTVPEAIVAKQMGLNILGMSLITNPAAGLEDGPINHEDVMHTGSIVSDVFTKLLSGILLKL